MRKVHIANGKFYLNNEPYFQRLVMNQGYYPDGIWTAPTDEALKNDILLSKKAGFNGARLHQKFFEERFHYWADKLGFITWGESPNWGMNPDDEVASRNLLSEWIEILERDRNHPSIITWAPLTVPLSNVTSGTFARLVFDLQKLTKAIDPSRPFNDLTGSGFHFLTDIWSISTYEPDATRFALSLKPDKNQAAYANQPFIIGEFGGIVWETSRTKEDTWGHGGTFTNEDANASKNSSMRFNPPESSADSAIHSFQISNKRKTVSTLTTGSLNLIWNGLDLSLKRFQADR